jgi:uncharacterized protein
MIVILYIILGSVTGIIAGMLGIGGGLVIVPGLAMIFKYYCGYSSEYMHLAAGTSLTVMIFTAIASMRTNQKQGRIVWPVFKRAVPWILAGDIAGAFIAGLLNAATLSILFGIVILLLALKMIIAAFKAKHEHEEKESINIRTSVIAVIGSVIGLKSGLFGIGGGAISVPFLNNAGLPMKKATGTSSAFTLPISIVGSICFIYIGIIHHIHIPHTIGYTHWPATLILVPCTMFFAPIGCTLSNRMPTKWLRILFILFLLFVSSKMLITSLCKI